MNPWDIFVWVLAICVSILTIAATTGMVVSIFSSNKNKEKN